MIASAIAATSSPSVALESHDMPAGARLEAHAMLSTILPCRCGAPPIRGATDDVNAGLAGQLEGVSSNIARGPTMSAVWPRVA
jgi:hypothetical protein